MTIEHSSRASSAAAPARIARAVRPHLEVLASPVVSTARIPFWVACIGVLVFGLASLLGLNIALSRGSYEIYAKQQEQTRLTEAEQQLTEELEVASSPARVASRARSLGMIQSSTPVFIRLSDGSVVGEGVPANGESAVPIADIPTARDPDVGDALAQRVSAATALQQQRAMEREVTSITAVPASQPQPRAAASAQNPPPGPAGDDQAATDDQAARQSQAAGEGQVAGQGQTARQDQAAGEGQEAEEDEAAEENESAEEDEASGQAAQRPQTETDAARPASPAQHSDSVGSQSDNGDTDTQQARATGVAEGDGARPAP
ncbi:MAG: hypothetical protein CSB46_03665 [Micrococcales bacterium]|nr:MAG: hypothetical protein CSB46_03665 [Micrococcales bacterium]